MYSSLKYTQRLEAAGFSRKQAEETVNLVLETMDHHFATKADVRESEFALRSDLEKSRTELKREIQELRTEVKQEIQELRTEMRHEFQSVRHEMALMKSQLTVTMGGIMMAGITILGTFQYFTR